MAFKFAARVMRQLGAELISADDVALYELVKNGFDARASKVSVEIYFYVDQVAIREIESKIRSTFREQSFSATRCETLVRETLLRIARNERQFFALSDSQLQDLSRDISAAKNLDAAILRIQQINKIIVNDNGQGMTKEDLEEHFLVVGTTHRKKEQDEYERLGVPYPDGESLSGEKGIGRLSAMRLGNRLQVKTSCEKALVYATLDVDWEWFELNPDKGVEDYDVRPQKHKSDVPLNGGTTLTIFGLRGCWQKKNVSDLANNKLAKFLNPFDRSATRNTRKRKLTVSWNDERIDLGAFSQKMLDSAHNGMKGTIDTADDGSFRAVVKYWFGNDPNKTEFSSTYSSAYFSAVSEDILSEIGPFSFELYHYVRPRITAIPGVADRMEVKEWLNSWCGGLMLFRDGIRVLPYGNFPEDDWLSLDQQALRGKGFRVNRLQVVGCVRISRPLNPKLVDQTNREGLQDNEVVNGFRQLLMDIISQGFVPHLDRFYSSEDASPDSLLPRVEEVDNRLTTAVEDLIGATQRNDKRATVLAKQSLLDAVKEVRKISDQLERLIANQKLHQLDVAELAAKGLSAEYLAHDLEAVLDSSISETGIIQKEKFLDERLRVALTHLSAVLKATRTQISAIKPGPSSRRRRRTNVELVAIAEQLVTLLVPRCIRHGITIKITAIPSSTALRAFVVEGHIRQILENILQNSVFWVLNTRDTKRNHAVAAINILIDTRARTVIVRDSGVGFSPDEIEWVFVPFNSHRKGGHGLGLALARELAEFNNIRITIDSSERNRWDRYTGIKLDFAECLPS